MKKLRAISLSGLIIVIFGIITCNVSIRPSQTPLPVIDSLKLDCSYEAGNRTGDQMTYSIRIPRIMSGLNDSVRARINHFLFIQSLSFGSIADTIDTSLVKINAGLLDSLEQFKRRVAAKDMSADTFTRTIPMTDINYVRYKVAFCQKSLLSIVFTIYTFYGGAHGYQFMKPFTFNMTTGKIIDLQVELSASGKDSFYITEKKEALRQYGNQMFDTSLFVKFIRGDKSKLNWSDTIHL